jgi:hypothetical protein
MFFCFDKNGDGGLNSEELKALLATVNPDFKDWELDLAVAKVGAGGGDVGPCCWWSC